MSLRGVGTESPVTLSPQATAADAVDLMDARGVGSVVIVEDGKPVSIVTDRDLVLKVLRHGLDPNDVRLVTIMTERLVTAPQDLSLDEAAWRMREHAVRRLPIVDDAGALVGIVTLDDLVGHLAALPAGAVEILSSFHAPYQFV